MGVTIESRQASDVEGTTSSRPPRPCARIDTASCTRTFIDPSHDAGESKPSSEPTSAGQSGRLDAFSSTSFTSSPSSTATLTYFPVFSPR